MPQDELIERLPRHLRLRELRIFVTVLDHGSFRKAAAALHVTQPAITKSIAGLEDILAVRLFDRTPNGVEPTAHGLSFAPHARAIFHELKSAARAIDVVSRGATGTLRLGTVPLPGGGFVPMAVHRLVRRNPGIFVSMTEGREPELSDLLRRREIDVALVFLTQVPPNDDLDAHTLFEAQLCVVSARNHRLAAQPVLTWDELSNELWVLPPASTVFSNQVRRTLARANLDMPRHSVESLSIHIQRSMVLHGGMLSFGSRSRYDVSPLHDLLVRLPYDLPTSVNAIGALTLRGRERSPLTDQLIDEIRRLSVSE